MGDLQEKEQNKLLYELVGFLHELVLSNIGDSKFTEQDAMMVSILMKRHGNKDDKQVVEWVKRCEREHFGLLKESSSVLLNKVHESFHTVLSQSVTIVKANNVTINKSYPK